MARVRSSSYRRLPEADSRTEWWVEEAGDTGRPLQEFLPEWDPDVDVRVAAKVRLTRAEIENHTGLGPESEILLGLTWHSRGTQTKGVGQVRRIPPGSECGEWELKCEAPGQRLGGQVRFRVAAILSHPGPTSDALAPQRVGSVVWNEERAVSLEGMGGRFPMTWIDFSSSPALPDKAAWSLDWDPENLHEDLLRGSRLFLNKAHPKLKDAIERPAKAESGPVLEMLHYDVGRTLIVGALGNPEFAKRPEDFEEGTVGWAVRRLVGATFPGYQTADLAHRMRREPVRFDRELQHGLRVLQALEAE